MPIREGQNANTNSNVKELDSTDDFEKPSISVQGVTCRCGGEQMRIKSGVWWCCF